ncbi:MAG: marine proteobacterial sortase target protein, partial [Alphaproteobacteria bacterium]
MNSSIRLSALFAVFGIIAVFMATQSALSAPKPVTVSPASGTVTLDNIHSGSLVYATKFPGQHIPAPLLGTEVDIKISGPMARVVVKQNFINPSDAWLEARYVFPLPENAAVNHMVVTTGDKKIVSEIKEKQKARKIYEKAKRSGRRAALFQQHRPNVFSTKVANIGPKATVTVEIIYLQNLRFDQYRFHLRFPMVVASRYTPRGQAHMVKAQPPGTENPERKDSWLDTPVRDPKLGKTNPVTLTITLDAGVPLTSLKSLHHKLAGDGWEDGAATLRLADKTVPAVKDFELVWTPKQGAVPASALFSETVAGETYYLAMMLPPRPDIRAVPPRDIVFVLDKSGSMSGKSIKQARKALSFALDRLRPSDRFNIIRFSNVTDQLFDSVRPANQFSLARAKQYVADTRADGGTEMRPALLHALAGDDVPDRLRQMVFLTDGAISNEDQLFKDIQQHIKATRLYTVGIGSAPNSHFMRRAAEIGRGSFTYIADLNNVAEKIRRLFRKIERPAMIDLAADWAGMSDGVRLAPYPKRLPDLHDGEPVMLAIRATEPLPKDKAKLTLSGRRGRSPWSQSISLDQARPAVGISTIWARQRITALTGSLRQGADRDSVKQAITATALRHKLVSKYTSLVAVEKTLARPADEPLFKRKIPLNLPDGWVARKVFGGSANPTQQNASRVKPAMQSQFASLLKDLSKQRVANQNLASASQPVPLPTGATAGPLQILLGLLALFAA